MKSISIKFYFVSKTLFANHGPKKLLHLNTFGRMAGHAANFFIVFNNHQLAQLTTFLIRATEEETCGCSKLGKPDIYEGLQACPLHPISEVEVTKKKSMPSCN